MLKMFSSDNQYFDRTFSKFGYPERDSIQKKFRMLRDQALSELEEFIPPREKYPNLTWPRKKFKRRSKIDKKQSER
jgi:hypothetical protein